MTCPRLAAPIVIILALTFGAGPAPAQEAQAPVKPGAPAAEAPKPGTEAPAPAQPDEAFGQEVTLPERTIVYLQGHSTWDNALDTLVDAFKSLDEYLAKQGITPNGPSMTIYTQTDDTGFSFRAAVPVAAPPKDAPKGDIAVGQAPSGKALKFVHHGAYDAMDSTYEAIINYLDEKGLEAKDAFVEEYSNGALKADDDTLLINVFVPVK
jgi:effector-binding domain-containing protein